MSHTVTVRILDRDVEVTCPPETQDDLREAARLLNKRLEALKKGNKLAGHDRLMTLCALNLAHEALAQKQKHHQDEHAIRDMIDRMTEAVGQTQRLVRQTVEQPL